MITPQFLRFCAIGVVGFLVDSGALLVLVEGLRLAPLTARIISFVCAASVTYVLNRHYTFRQLGGATLRQWSTYVLTTAIGALINIGVYRQWVAFMGAKPSSLIMGVALGSVVALFFNYSISRIVVFRSDPV